MVYTMLIWVSTFLLCFSISITAQTKIKRQIYREQVLPLSGGKIPEDAFRADRLALNRLNKEGIAIPDGILLEHRSVHSHPHRNKHDPEDEDSVLKIIQQPEHRFTPDEGRYHNERPATVSSTYLIRKPIGPEETNILTPDKQRPLHQLLLYSQNGRVPDSPPPPQHLPRYPIPSHASHSHRYHHTHPDAPKPFVAYHPIPVPFDLPNREIQQETYFLKNFASGFLSDELSGRIEYPLLINNLDHTTSEFENFLPHDYEDFYSQPELLAPYSNFYSSLRFGRRSLESFNKGSSKNRQQQAKSSTRRPSSRKPSQSKCSNNPNSPNKCRNF